MTRSVLIDALENTRTRTENGMPTHSGSGRDVLDAFYKLGGGRALPDGDLRTLVARAYDESPVMALKLFAYNRDIRGGQGERRSFRIAFRWLADNHPAVARQFIPFVPFYGRFDDLFVAMDSPIERDVLGFYSTALANHDGLAAKWAPREKKKFAAVATKLRSYMGITPRQYRKMLAELSNTVETHMCAKDWTAINYSHVPSVAANRLRKAFYRNDLERYQQYIAELAKPVSERAAGVKVNADAIFPHNIVEKFMTQRTYSWDAGYSRSSLTPAEVILLEAQWAALPEYCPADSRTLALVDTSGSMMGEAMNVSVALGIYLSERLTGPFKDTFFTFSAKPQLHRLTGKLGDRIRQLSSQDAGWCGNTNLELVFRVMLATAVQNQVDQSEMPTTLIIFSDMQFDQAVTGYSDTAFEMIRRLYAEAGYVLPKIVFWNLRTSSGVPARYDTKGTALVSGFSPSTLKHILAGRMDPVLQMEAVLNSERYEVLNAVRV